MYNTAAMALAGMAAFGSCGQANSQLGGQGGLGGQFGLGSANLFTPSFKQEMQTDVDSWLKDWDVGNE